MAGWQSHSVTHWRQPTEGFRDGLAPSCGQRCPVPNNETVERARQELVNTTTRRRTIVKGGPPKHATQGNSIVKSHEPGIQLGPPILRATYIVHEVGHHQGPCWTVDQDGLFQPETFDEQFIHHAKKSWLRRRTNHAINPKV